MCWLGWHMWRRLDKNRTIGPSDNWGVRQCRVCRVKEQAMYNALTGLYWVQV